jgi:phosphate transport system protein
VQHFFKELDELNARLLEMCTFVEESIHDSVSAVVNRDSEVAHKVFEHETRINQLEILIDKIAFRLLALQQPVAVDLRFVTMSMKINNNLERMGDIAVNIAERAISLLNPQPVMPQIDIPHMSRLAEDMIRNSIDAFIRRDPDLANKVLDSDDAVDHLRDEMYGEIVKYMGEDVHRIHPGIDYMFVARGLERLADHATNIAEDVLFFVQGVDVRHHAPKEL